MPTLESQEPPAFASFVLLFLSRGVITCDLRIPHSAWFLSRGKSYCYNVLKLLFIWLGNCYLSFQSFLKGETQIPTDEAFQASVHHYNDCFLRSERIAQIVAGGALSQHDCREVFR